VIATDRKASRTQAKALNWAKKHRHEGAWFKKSDLRKIGVGKQKNVLQEKEKNHDKKKRKKNNTH